MSENSFHHRSQCYRSYSYYLTLLLINDMVCADACSSHLFATDSC